MAHKTTRGEQPSGKILSQDEIDDMLARIDTRSEPEKKKAAREQDEALEQELQEVLNDKSLRAEDKALMDACLDGDFTKLKELIAGGANVNFGFEGTALFSAIIGKGDEGIALYLIEKGADVNQPDRYGNTPLMAAAGNNRLKVAKVLLEHGGMVNVNHLDGYTPLISAAHNATVPMIDLLLAHGAQIDRIDNDGCTALMWALQFDMFENAAFLIEKGADTNHADKSGETPVDIAKKKNNLELIELMQKTAL